MISITIHIMASSVCLAFTVLLAVSASHATHSPACQETDIVVLTAVQLREEIRSQLNEAFAEALPQVCGCGPHYNGTQPLTHSDVVAAIVNLHSLIGDFFEDTLQPELMTPGYTSHLPASSCKEILELAPDSPSGLYWIRGTDNRSQHMYCDMERSCNGVGGGWMRVASINMTDPSSTCPSGLKTIWVGSHRLCAMDINGGGCSSAVLPVEGVQYSRVCGKIIGYQQKTPDGFSPYINGGQTTIDSHYVDGISLTHGNSPRKHIWTFVAALHEYNSHRDLVCPCTNTRNNPPPAVPPFVGQDYFCDTGSENHYQHIFYGDDPLWDGAGCGQFSTCCSLNSPQWFLKEVSPPTSDDIEMRLCADQDRWDEDITFETLEIYIQ